MATAAALVGRPTTRRGGRIASGGSRPGLGTGAARGAGTGAGRPRGCGDAPPFPRSALDPIDLVRGSIMIARILAATAMAGARLAHLQPCAAQVAIHAAGPGRLTSQDLLAARWIRAIDRFEPKGRCIVIIDAASEACVTA